MLKAWGQNAFVGGNLGIPLVDAIGKDYDWQVVELSSFQLETIDSFRPRYAVLLNVTEDHLDRYPADLVLGVDGGSVDQAIVEVERIASAIGVELRTAGHASDIIERRRRRYE